MIIMIIVGTVYIFSFIWDALLEQKSITVGCVLPAAIAVSGGGVSARWGGWCLPRGCVCPGGLSA